MSQDKYLICKDCGNEFLFSAEEQDFYAEKGFENEPARCKGCRQVRKQQRNNGGFRSRDGRKDNKPQFNVICSECGQETTVPFEPTAGKPVYCRECFQTQKR